MNFSRHLYAAGGILVVLSALSLGAGGKAPARSQPMSVLVTNSTLNPVNTKAVGTTQVAGAVNVSGTVMVGNSNPIVVHSDSDNRTPVMLVRYFTFASSESGASDVFYQVPAGKMFVVQTAAVKAELADGDSVASAEYSLDAGAFVIPISYSEVTHNTYIGISNGTYYFTEGQQLDVAAFRNVVADRAFFRMELTGYLVPMPAAGP